MLSQTINDYFSCITPLARSLDSNPGATRAILHLIEQYKDEMLEDRSKGEFFKGEYAFYSGQYERSLKHYLEAKDIEDFEFFCYRASAYVSKAQGNLEKAIKFAEKARAVFSDDFPTLTLLKSLFEECGRQAEADHLSQHIQTLRPSIESETCVADKTPALTLGANEIKELAGIFEPHTEDQLFAEEILNVPNYAPASEFSLEQFSIDTSSPCTKKEDSHSFIEGLEGSILAFRRQQSDLLDDYIATWKNRSQLSEYGLYIFQGWHQPSLNHHVKTPVDSMPFWLTETSRKSSGGFYVRWNGKGIVINPGRHFIEELHRQGLHVKDIDYVISTKEDPESYSGITEIWELNYRLNHAAGSLHIIHYYLNPHVYQSLSTVLKPHFKQERDAIHGLELFMDSPEVEKIDIGQGIRLHYFPGANDRSVASIRGRDKLAHPLTLGIRLELAFSEEGFERVVNIGYLSEIAWSPLLGHRLGPCDILLAGFGNTNAEDYTKKNYTEDALGYFGTCSLLEEVVPQLLLCAEFGGREGDIRLEVIRKMRKEYAENRSSNAHSVILPADAGLFVDLTALHVKCSASATMIPVADVKVTNPSGDFGRLSYLAPDCCL